MRNLSEEEFDKKYYAYKDTIYSIAYTYVHNQSDADDITQDVFIKYLKSDTTFNDDNHEKYWLIRVTINTAKNFVSSTWKKRVVLDDDYVDRTSDNDTRSESNQYFDVITSLPSKYKDVITLYYYEDWSVEEIADILKVSCSCVRKRLERGREKIKKEIENGRFREED